MKLIGQTTSSFLLQALFKSTKKKKFAMSISELPNKQACFKSMPQVMPEIYHMRLQTSFCSQLEPNFPKTNKSSSSLSKSLTPKFSQFVSQKLELM
jgi:hypothetical protein